MSALRASTAQEHQELEDEVGIVESLKSEDGYRNLLETFYGIVAPLEAQLAQFPWEKLELNFNQRRKAHLLERDLSDLGVDTSTLPQCDELPALESFEEACGALYVSEGSTLGGQHILRMARQAELPESATRYFQSYGPRVGEMWKDLGGAFNSYAEGGERSPRLIDGARKTFRAFQHWFQTCRASK